MGKSNGLMRSRLRIGLWLVVASNVLFAVTDVRLAGDVLPWVYLIKGLQLAVVALALWWLPRCRSRRGLNALALGAVAAIDGLVAVSGAVTDDVASTLILCLATAWACATLLPWGTRPQIAAAVIAGLASLLNVGLTTGSLEAAVSYPAIAAAIAFGLSVFVAREFERHRRALERHERNERARAAEELRERDRRLRLITETIDEVFWMADFRMERTLYVSPGCERIWGRSAESLYLAPRSFLDAVHPDDRDEVMARLKAIAPDEPFEHEYRIVRPDGTLRWIWNRGYPVREDGAVQCYAGVAQDITERRQLEEQLAQSRKMEAVGRLAGGIAHDFNNQLFVINGYAEMLQQRFGNDAIVGPQLKEIRQAGERAAGLIRQLLAFGRKQVLEPRVIDLDDELAALEGMLRPLIKEDIALRIERQAGLGKVRVDPVQIDQVVINLVMNARDAMPRGGNLEIAIASVQIDEEHARAEPVVPAGNYVRLTVADSGSGMSSETLSRVFEPFFTTKEQGKGTGLGLATVYGIVAQSGGYIRAASTPGEGTRFDVYLPRLAEAG